MDFEEHINNLLSEFDYELVIYDEVEYFKNYKDPEFDYPYQERRTKIGNQKFNVSINDDLDYNYESKQIRFRIS
jgi:hypothetical protein